MRIGVVSDTHGQVPFTLDAVRMLESLEVDLVLHCGDIGSPEIVALFAAWPTHFVFGNVDDHRQRLRSAILAAGQRCHEYRANPHSIAHVVLPWLEITIVPL